MQKTVKKFILCATMIFSSALFCDAGGLRTRMIDPESTNIYYEYDARGAMTKISKGGSAHGAYYHDDLGRETRRRVSDYK